MSTLYIRHPSKALTDQAAAGVAPLCSFALASAGGAIEREGMAALRDLAVMVSQASRVVLLLAASDVSLFRVKTPPLSAAKLRLALPNLVEDQMMSDPADCIVVAAATAPASSAGGLRSVAVVQRIWLERLASSLVSLGARKISALPSQLCLPYQAGAVAASVDEQPLQSGGDVALTLRLSEQEGIGLPVAPEQTGLAAREVLQALRALAPATQITLYVPNARVTAYRELADSDITVAADHWPRWIAGSKSVSLNLMAGLQSSGAAADWRRWRWPILLAVSIMAINLAGLNLSWWRMRGEANALRAGMLQTFKAAYPKETVIQDPLAQMRQQIAFARRDSGQPAPDDFAVLLAAFGEAAGGLSGAKSPAIGALEYRERSLLVRLKQDDPAGLSEPVKATLASRHLSLTRVAPGTWQIRAAAAK